MLYFTECIVLWPSALPHDHVYRYYLFLKKLKLLLTKSDIFTTAIFHIYKLFILMFQKIESKFCISILMKMDYHVLSGGNHVSFLLARDIWEYKWMHLETTAHYRACFVTFLRKAISFVPLVSHKKILRSQKNIKQSIRKSISANKHVSKFPQNVYFITEGKEREEVSWGVSTCLPSLGDLEFWGASKEEGGEQRKGKADGINFGSKWF